MKKITIMILMTGIIFFTAVLMTGATESQDMLIIENNYVPMLEKSDLPYTFKNLNFIVVEWNRVQQQTAEKLGIPFTLIDKNISKEQSYYIFELRYQQNVPAEWTHTILYRNDKDIVIRISPDKAEEWISKGYHAIRIMHRQYQWAKAPAYIPYTCGYTALVADLLSRTTQNQWLDWDKKISGVDPVTIGTNNYYIRTRNSPQLFNGSNLGKAYDFALQQAQNYHYGSNIEQDTYPYPYSSQTWKNLVLTIPGQTNPNDIVILSAHYDSTSGSASTNAPGADDNGSGSVTLYEAMRILRQYRFQRTIKIIFFTGEEQGLLGSEAYVNDHPISSILGVVNMDMFGWDGNDDRCFEIHAGTMTSSQDVGKCFSDSIDSYSINLTYDFLTTDAGGGSDHVSFWNVNVGAIEILENGDSNSQPGGCVGVDWNPYYHTTEDTIAHLNVPYVYDISRAGLATIAGMAVPIQACFTIAPTLTATPALLQVDLSWTAVTGASTYRVYRSTQGCQGQWFEQTETAGTSYSDTNVIGNTPYYYYVEAVSSDGFCVSTMSNCASATPPACISCAGYQQDSAIITSISGGDNDVYPDNCESPTARVTVENIGSGTALNTQVTISSSAPFITITTPMPITIGDIPHNGSANASFTFAVGAGTTTATCMQSGSFSVLVQSQGQNPAEQDSFTFIYEIDYILGNKHWAFEPDTGLEGWTVNSGNWTLSSVRINPGGSTRSVHASHFSYNHCDVMQSPVFEPTATSQLTVPNWYSIQPVTNNAWYDRANAHVINTETSTRTLISPVSGKLYQTGNFYDFGGSCQIHSEPGWAGDTGGNTWGNSVFDLSPFTTQKLSLELRYITDSTIPKEGIYVDDIIATNVKFEACDQQKNICGASLQPFNLQKPHVNDSSSPKANGIIDTDETVQLDSRLENVGSATATSVIGELTTTAPIVINNANAVFSDIDADANQLCTTCYSLTAPSANRPATHWDFTVTENVLADNFGPAPYQHTYHVGESFSDVPVLNEYYIENIFHSGVTSGCTSTTFCPAAYVSRNQMAKFICLSMNKKAQNSCLTSSCAGLFSDVPASNPFCSFIESLYNAGIVSGCQSSPLHYCPNNFTQRQAMAKIVCNSMNVAEPNSCITTTCSGIFADVSSSNPFCPYIEALYNGGIVSGCQSSPLLYCPNNNVQRQQMAKFLALGFSLSL